MTIEYIGNGLYRGTVTHYNGQSVLSGRDRNDIMYTLLKSAYEVEENRPNFRRDEEAWTDDDWERDFVKEEISSNHKDDDKI